MYTNSKLKELLGPLRYAISPEYWTSHHWYYFQVPVFTLFDFVILVFSTLILKFLKNVSVLNFCHEI